MILGVRSFQIIGRSVTIPLLLLLLLLLLLFPLASSNQTANHFTYLRCQEITFALHFWIYPCNYLPFSDVTLPSSNHRIAGR